MLEACIGRSIFHNIPVQVTRKKNNRNTILGDIKDINNLRFFIDVISGAVEGVNRTEK